MKNKSTLFIIHYALPVLWNLLFLLIPLGYILIIITLLSCTTSPQTGNLSGTVQLQGEEDHSGIIIGVYELSELDPDIVAINEEYDFIGVIINQMTEFDHRFENLTKYTQTDENGNFKIKDIPTGRYNLMAMKDGFGFKYIYEVTIAEGENALEEQRKKEKGKRKKVNIEENDSFNLPVLRRSSASEDGLPFTFNLNKSEADIILYPVTYISSDIDTSTTWKTDHNYIISPESGNNITVSGALTIEPGAIIRINEGVKLTISGDLTAIGDEENMIWFTSNDSLNTHLPIYPSTPSPFNRIELTGAEAKQVAFCKFDHAGTGLLNKVNGFSISDCIFRNSSCGFKSENVDSTFCSNLLCENITNASEGGIYFSGVENGCIEKNIVNDCEIGIQVKDESNPNIKDNNISYCSNGIFVTWYSSPVTNNNEINYSNNAIVVTHRSIPIIEKNNVLNCEIGIKNIYHWCNNPFSIHYNNLKCSSYYVYLNDGMCYADIFAENNYFFTEEISQISNMIFDYNDNHDLGEVIFQPFLTQEYLYAGISK